MSLDHFIEKLDVSKQKKNKIRDHLSGWKTPQIKSCFEPIAMGQKPLEGTFLKNTLKYNVSLMNTNIKQGLRKNMFPSNVVSHELWSKEFDRVFLFGNSQTYNSL